jgi:hypothetical protein
VVGGLVVDVPGWVKVPVDVGREGTDVVRLAVVWVGCSVVLDMVLDVGIEVAEVVVGARVDWLPVADGGGVPEPHAASAAATSTATPVPARCLTRPFMTPPSSHETPGRQARSPLW